MNKSLILILFLLYSLHFAAQTFEVPFISQPDTLVKTMLPFHDAGAAGRDLTWDFKSLSQGEDYAVCLSFPKATDFANNLKIITTGSDIYDSESTNVEKILAVTSFILFGVNNI